MSRYHYDIDGIRVRSVVDGAETRYLIDANRPYAQVLEEYTPGGVIQVSYVYGHDLISQDRGEVRSYYHVDGLGSTRALTDARGLVTDRYVYDAFGRTIGQVGSTGNVYLFAGEQRDANLGLDYLRARYLSVGTGRFVSRDIYSGSVRSPMSLHRYLYANANPANGVDPSGKFTLVEASLTLAISSVLQGYQLGIAAGATVLALRLYWPFYGNWCGPQHGGNMYNVPPSVDDFDRACMWHDLRYIRYGYFDASSDQNLINDIDDVLAGQYDDKSNFRAYFFREPDPSNPNENYIDRGVTPLGGIIAGHVKQYLLFGLSNEASPARRGLWLLNRLGHGVPDR